MSDAKARESLVAFGRSMFARRLTFGSSGNLSVKVDDGSAPDFTSLQPSPFASVAC